MFIFISLIRSISLWKKKNSKQNKQNKNLPKPTEENWKRQICIFVLLWIWTYFILNYSDARKSVIEWHMLCGSFTVEIELTGMCTMRSVQKLGLVLTRPTVKHTSSTCRVTRHIYVKDGPDRPIQSRIPGPISDIGPVTTKIIPLWKMLWPRNWGLGHSENDTFW